MHQAYMEGAQAKEDVLFEEKMLGESVELPMPYASGGFGEGLLDTEDAV